MRILYCVMEAIAWVLDTVDQFFGEILDSVINPLRFNSDPEDDYDEEEESAPRPVKPLFKRKSRVDEKASRVGNVTGDAAGLQRALQYCRENAEDSFHDRLFYYIDAFNMTDAEVYKRANIDRKLFSKIRCNPGYCPRKRTVLALSIALELDVYETEDLLRSAGYSLSHSDYSDLIVEYCIKNRLYDVFRINDMLYDLSLPLLGS